MRFKKYIPLLIYLLLIIGCFLIVRLTERLVEPDKEQGEEPPVSSEAVTPESESGWQETPEPSSAVESEAEPSPESSSKEPGYPFYEKEWWEEEEETDTGEEEELYRVPVLMLASDLHYISRKTHDGGSAFWEMVAQDDGKISEYSDILIDTLVEEAITDKPSALILTGDITLNGERENHLGLAEKLHQVTEEGVPVLVIPGNHDIKNRNAATYFGNQRESAEYLENAEDFFAIYHEFGYDQAFSRDEASLS